MDGIDSNILGITRRDRLGWTFRVSKSSVVEVIHLDFPCQSSDFRPSALPARSANRHRALSASLLLPPLPPLRVCSSCSPLLSPIRPPGRCPSYPLTLPPPPRSTPPMKTPTTTTIPPKHPHPCPCHAHAGREAVWRIAHSRPRLCSVSAAPRRPASGPRSPLPRRSGRTSTAAGFACRTCRTRRELRLEGSRPRR